MNTFEFLVPRRPLSHQAKDSRHKRDWGNFVYGRAFREWVGTSVSNERLRFTLVYLCEDDPPDINNIIKPVQDALIGLVYSDDKLIVDVQGHLRMTDELIDVPGYRVCSRMRSFSGQIAFMSVSILHALWVAYYELGAARTR